MDKPTKAILGAVSDVLKDERGQTEQKFTELRKNLGASEAELKGLLAGITDALEEFTSKAASSDDVQKLETKLRDYVGDCLARLASDESLTLAISDFKTGLSELEQSSKGLVLESERTTAAVEERLLSAVDKFNNSATKFNSDLEIINKRLDEMPTPEPGKDGLDRVSILPRHIAENTRLEKNEIVIHNGGLFQSTKKTLGNPTVDPMAYQCLVTGVTEIRSLHKPKERTIELWARLSDGSEILAGTIDALPKYNAQGAESKSLDGDFYIDAGEFHYLELGVWKSLSIVGGKGDEGKRGRKGMPGAAAVGIDDIQAEGQALTVYLTDGTVKEFIIDVIAPAPEEISQPIKRYAGTYNFKNSYEAGDLVTYANGISLAIRSGTAPIDDKDYWVKITAPAGGPSIDSGGGGGEFNNNYVITPDGELDLALASNFGFVTGSANNTISYSNVPAASTASHLTVLVTGARANDLNLPPNTKWLENTAPAFGFETLVSIMLINAADLRGIASAVIVNFFDPSLLPSAIAINNNVALMGYEWTATGYGTKFADPAAGSFGNDVIYNGAGDIVFSTGFPFISAYEWTAIGFGPKFADPTALGGLAEGIDISPTQDAVIAALNGTPYIVGYPWSAAGFGAKFADPSTLPTGIGNGIAFSPAGTEVILSTSTAPRQAAYEWSAAGFGTKFADPSAALNNLSRGVAFTSIGPAVAFTTFTSPFIFAFPWSAAGYGVKFANPASLPGGVGIKITFSAAGDVAAMSNASASPGIVAYAWSASGFGARFTNPSQAPAGSGAGIAFSRSDTELSVGHGGAPFISTYPWSAAGFGTRYANPATPLTSGASGIAFN